MLWSLTVREGLILCTKYALSKGSLHYSLGWFGKQELGWGLGLTSTSTPVLLLNHKAALAFDLHRVWNTFEDTSYMSKYTLQTAIYLKYFLDMFFLVFLYLYQNNICSIPSLFDAFGICSLQLQECNFCHFWCCLLTESCINKVSCQK